MTGCPVHGSVGEAGGRRQGAHSKLLLSLLASDGQPRRCRGADTRHRQSQPQGRTCPELFSQADQTSKAVDPIPALLSANQARHEPMMVKSFRRRHRLRCIRRRSVALPPRQQPPAATRHSPPPAVSLRHGKAMHGRRTHLLAMVGPLLPPKILPPLRSTTHGPPRGMPGCQAGRPRMRRWYCSSSSWVRPQFGHRASSRLIEPPQHTHWPRASHRSHISPPTVPTRALPTPQVGSHPSQPVPTEQLPPTRRPPLRPHQSRL